MRLLTRLDFDGLACGVILKKLGIIKMCRFVHPKDIQDKTVEVGRNDILANVPYIEGCKLWFDHHISEIERLGDISFEGACKPLESAARVLYEYYGGRDWYPEFDEMVTAVDKYDSADLSKQDVLNPKSWILLGIILDPRTGLGRFSQFRIGGYELTELLIDACADKSINEILTLPDIMERADLYFNQVDRFREMLNTHSRLDGNVVITDLRGISPIYPGNRFVIYEMFPEANISVWIVDGYNKNCPISVGRSIFNRTSNINIGSLMLKYGGGGLEAAGACQIAYTDANQVIDEIIRTIHE